MRATAKQIFDSINSIHEAYTVLRFFATKIEKTGDSYLFEEEFMDNIWVNLGLFDAYIMEDILRAWSFDVDAEGYYEVEMLIRFNKAQIDNNEPHIIEVPEHFEIAHVEAKFIGDTWELVSDKMSDDLPF